MIAAVGEEDWRDKFERLREDHGSLRKKHEDLKEELKRQATKIRSTDHASNLVDGVSHHEYMRSLFNENQALVSKCRSLELRLARVHAKTTGAASTPKASSRASKSVKTKHAAVQVDAMDDAGGQIGEPHAAAALLVAALRHRLDELEGDLMRLTQENEMLLAEYHAIPSTDERSGHVHVARVEASMAFDMTLLEQKYTDLEAQLCAAKTVHAQTMAQMEIVVRDNLALKADVARFRGISIESDAKDRTIHALRDEVLRLRNDALRLHDAVDHLSSRPFNNPDAALNLQTLILQLADMEGQVEVLTAQLANEAHHARLLTQAKKTLQARVAALESQLHATVRAEEALRLQSQETQLQLDMTAFQLRLAQDPTNDLLVDALARATKAAFTPSKVSFLDDYESSLLPSSDETLRHVRAATLSVEVAKHQHAATVAQVLNEDLVDEVRRLRQQHESEVAFWKAQAAATNSRLRAAKSRMRQLQAAQQQRQYPVRKPPASISNEWNELVVVLGPLTDVALALTSVFLVVDYGDFESQLSPVVQPATSSLEFAVSFKCIVDDAFFASIHLGLELHVLDQRQSLVGMGLLHLEPLLASASGRLQTHVSLVHVTSGSHVASVIIDAQLQTPVDALYHATIGASPSTITTTAVTDVLYELTIVSVLLTNGRSGEIVYSFLGFDQVVVPFATDDASSSTDYVTLLATRRFPVQQSARLVHFMRSYVLQLSMWDVPSIHAPHRRLVGTAQLPCASIPCTLSLAIDAPTDTPTTIGRFCVHLTTLGPGRRLAPDRAANWFAALRLQFRERCDVRAVALVLFADARFVLFRNRAMQTNDPSGWRHDDNSMDAKEWRHYLMTLSTPDQAVCVRLVMQTKWEATWLAVEHHVRMAARGHRQVLDEVASNSIHMTWAALRPIFDAIVRQERQR
ncbi:Aste57867_25405 [Aphanomyces stellatus]|uniref:Aste57867_25405 protein n=1 Tax=Aphanomyces stellatus TaxID=120398 RepID=A0A485LSY5_9STRA|nr:hypothetical protein As57867_025326 [Aphanomyces stellatus]VFU02029.1 Aste57867_25405 [Aphanomyces stellatus]